MLWPRSLDALLLSLLTCATAALLGCENLEKRTKYLTGPGRDLLGHAAGR